MSGSNINPLSNSGMNSPPRGPQGRKASVVERTIGTNMLRRNSSSSSTPVLNPPTDDIIFSMNPEDYELGTTIGYGSSAIVCIAKYKPLGKIVAMKVIDLDMFERNQIDELRREIQIMSLSKHPNLLPVYGSFVNGSKLYIVTPFLSAGSCLDIMKTAYPNGLEESAIATILKQALQGLEYLHKNGLIHRDVKAGNLLVDEDGLVQLADFGVSSSLMDTGERKGIRKTFVGTPCWMAPEVMEQSGYDYKADIWSFGITALELATGHAPFAKYPPLKVLMLTLQNDPPTLDREQTAHKYSKSFKDMIDSCLQKDPAKRPIAEKLLQHSFFKQATKRRQHLQTDILQNLPPITKRQHNKKSFPPERDDSKGISWDFGPDDDTEDKKPAVHFAPTPQEHPPDPDDILRRVLSKDVDMSDSPVAATSPVPLAFIANVTTQEIKKGRFSVSESNQASPNEPKPAESPSLAPSPSQEGSRRVSENPIDVRPSRFTVKNSMDGNPPASVTTAAPIPQPSGGSQPAPDKRGRFEVSSVDTPQGSQSDTGPSPNSSPSNSLGRGSRFTTSLIPPSAHTLSQPPMGPASPPDDRFDTIIKQNEQMRQMLTDIMAGMNKSKPVEVEMTEVAPEVSPHDAQVLAILQENEMLRQENAHLREAVVALETRLKQLAPQ